MDIIDLFKSFQLRASQIQSKEKEGSLQEETDEFEVSSEQAEIVDHMIVNQVFYFKVVKKGQATGTYVKGIKCKEMYSRALCDYYEQHLTLI